MKKTNVVVPWDQGLHIRPAGKLIGLTKRFRSEILIKTNGKVADARSIINIMLLCATFGTLLEVEISGDDESSAVAAIEQLFETGGDSDDAQQTISKEDSELF
jgi:phosphocarrier protein